MDSHWPSPTAITKVSPFCSCTQKQHNFKTFTGQTGAKRREDSSTEEEQKYFWKVLNTLGLKNYYQIPVSIPSGKGMGHTSTNTIKVLPILYCPYLFLFHINNTRITNANPTHADVSFSHLSALLSTCSSVTEDTPIRFANMFTSAVQKLIY